MIKPTASWLDWVFTNPPAIVFYHQNCSDGLMAAMVHMQAYDSRTHRALKFEYVGIAAGQNIDRIKKALQNIATGSIIHMVDVSTDPYEFEKEFPQYTLLMFDHHSKPVADWTEFFREPDFAHGISFPGVNIYYDITKSGAGIVADLLGTRTELVDLVEDRDLWLFKYGERTELAAETLNVLQADPHVWYESLPLSGRLDDIAEKYRKAGQQRLEHRYIFIDKWIAQHATYRVKLGDHLVRAIVAPTKWHSEMSNEMLKREPGLPIVMIYPIDDEKQSVTLSMRSTKDTLVTAETVGQQFPGQGGGHVNAYGVRLHRNQIPDVLWRAASILNQAEYEKSN